MTRLRLTLVAIGALLAFAGPASAHQAAAPTCATDIVTAAAKGTVTAWYSQGCYTRSVKLLGSDLRDYSDVPDIIANAKRRDALRRLRITVGTRAPSSRVSVKLSPATGAIRVSIFAKKNGRFVVAAIGTLSGAGGTLKAKLGKATRIRVSAGYVGSGDKPVTVSTTLKR